MNDKLDLGRAKRSRVGVGRELGVQAQWHGGDLHGLTGGLDTL